MSTDGSGAGSDDGSGGGPADGPERNEPASASASSGFRAELAASVRVVDVLLLLLVPGALLAVFALPESVRRGLAFSYTDPTLATAFASHFVHLDASHLAGNAVGYALLAGVGYAIAVLSAHRRFFLTALATFLLAFPIALSALNLAVPRDAIGFGFSGINMALAGLLPLLLGVYARERFVPSASLRALPAAFFPLVGWIALLALPRSTDGFGLAGTATAVAGVLLGILYASSTGVRLRRSTLGSVRDIASRPGYGDLFVAGAVLVVGYPVVGFPADPTGEGSVVNLYVHLLGFCLAFIGPFALLAGGAFEE
nr:hypothetical protein [Halorubrum aidingense]